MRRAHTQQFIKCLKTTDKDIEHYLRARIYKDLKPELTDSLKQANRRIRRAMGGILVLNLRRYLDMISVRR